MQTYSAFFQFELGAEETADQYSWWKPLLSRFLVRCNLFRIDCKPGEEAGLRSCARMGAADFAAVHVEGRNEVWEGRIEERFIYELINEPLDADGRVKWNSVFLKKDDRILLSITKSGREFGAHGIDKEDINFLCEIIQGYPFTLYFWDRAKSGEMISFHSAFGQDSELEQMFHDFMQS